MVSTIAIPIILQQLVENLVSLADSVMISGYSSIGVSAVQIGSQWESIASLFSFGICSGVGIYTAQFIGSRDMANLKKSFGTMITLSLLVSIPFIALAFIIPKPICGFFIQDAAVVQDGAAYLMITSVSYLFVMISFSYNYTYRCMGKTKVAMYIAGATVLINCLLIHPHLRKAGASCPGVVGAAVAALLSRALGTLMYGVFPLSRQPFLGTFAQMFRLDREFCCRFCAGLPPLSPTRPFCIGRSCFKA
ncbi:MAG: MATE family efflux transporter [Oscillospiraceae bacterium]